MATGLQDLPNEILVQIFSLLETRAILHIRSVCRRLRAVTGDPIHWSAISWRASNRIGDAGGLKLALKLSEGVLKHLSLYQVLSMPQCMEQILTCHSIQSIYLNDVTFTEEQITQVVHMPTLSYLKVDEQFESVIEIIATTGSLLKTLAIVLDIRCESDTPVVNCWSDNKYFPPNLHISCKYAAVHFEAKNHLTLPPSTSHDAYLLYYEVSESNISESVYPLLQFSFTPSVSLSAVHYVDLRTQLEVRNLFDVKLKFEDICHNLTGLSSFNINISPSELVTVAGSCPNLKYLNLSCCKEVLSDLAGLTAVAAGCPKLQELDLRWTEVECVDSLWKVMSLMSSLRVLAIPARYAAIREQPSPMPRLTTIRMTGRLPVDKCNHHLVMKCLTSIPSLRYFSRHAHYYIPGILNCATNLTHLCLEIPNMTSLPTNPSVYTNLEQLYLILNDDYFDHNNVADALCESKKLRVLGLRVRSIEEKDIIKLASSLESLYKLRISTPKSFQEGFAELVRSVVARKGRTIDFIITCLSDMRYPSWM